MYNANWKENFKNKLEEIRNSERFIDYTIGDKVNFVKNCELVYGISTEELVLKLESNGYEGSPDYRKWYKFAKELKEM